ncbi:hypothetical protein M2139_000319 [Enterococcus sp. PF1-24]|uniref:hypothetical protein n=1 Tax=unclassified Enterococcus TaxID=2608891 RepID=UPI002476FA37|nr:MULTISPECIES: hypothetical protein [unclassified Enterococcus]MDH6363261.1 hypothetical protein [Enterococcus sp. PFB1-1]MDH6400438.1 hypothetical protein [Enterococcus sp. PF1-24]
MSEIQQLWEKECLPTKDGIYFKNGQAQAMIVKYFPKPNIEFKEYFNDSDFIKQYCGDEITNIDTLDKVILKNLRGTVYVGEGSFGSEGFISYVDNDDSLTWVFYFEESNPFIKVTEASNGSINVISSAGYSLNIPINEPQRISILNLD